MKRYVAITVVTSALWFILAQMAPGSALATEAVAARASSADSLPLTVVTQSGSVRGAGAEVVAFKGIPYSAPPTGDRRWRPPVQPAGWMGVRDATQFGPQCPQPPSGPTTLSSSEDCLTLNVWTPAKSSGDRLPVMVWLHGGGFVVGSGGLAQYDGEQLARRGVVVVTLNYRLGALGFLAHPELSRESEHGVSGNYGLLDQIAALQWVHANIAAFGGDPAAVTLFGQSGGAWSIGVHLVSPLARGLFQRAIAESVPRLVGPKQRLKESYYGLRSAEAQGSAGASDLATLRALKTDEVLSRLRPDPTISAGVHYFPVIDGYVLPDDPDTLIGTASQMKVPLLIGHTTDEGPFFANDAPQTVAGYRDFVRARFSADFFDAIVARYPATVDTEARAATLHLFADSELVAPSVLTARAASKVSDVYMYQFSRVSPLSRSRWGAASHGAEIPYVFAHVTADPSQFEDRDRTLSNAVAGAWVQFAKAGNPNGTDLPRWPAYNSPEYQVLEYGDEVTVQSNAQKPEVEFFQRTFETMRGKK